ncbi:SulP family inorganic anion transporter [Pontivivens ytuae]|uniref:STAS domain-containing protein n=1 Tax=Pontivivens ytuae TaxID=2789856 RepID=A0A7S9LT05_9RHOB|nr:SulP family inorganic anion transporter [Pontivivens ytuae]QPH54596.1 STAS domain-containing protein [Pontivivens ytuae]
MALRPAALIPPWVRDYDIGGFGADLLAGLILAILLIPQAMAYALLAGLPPEAGLYTAMVAPLLYAALGGSAFVSVGPVALASLVVADAIAGTELEPMAAAAIIAVESGAILLILGAVRLGRLVNFVSEPALLGFTAAIAVLIAVSQLPAFLGLDLPRAGNLIDAVPIFAGAGAPDGMTVAVGASVLALLFLANGFADRAIAPLALPAPVRLAVVKGLPLLIIAGAALIARPFDVARVQAPSGGLPQPMLPLADPSAWLGLLPSSGLVALVVFVTGTAVAKSLPRRRNDALNTDREALAVGAASVAAGVTGGFAPGISLSRSALVESSGARSPLSSAIGGLIVLPVILFAGPLLAALPEAALAALILSAIVGLVKVRDIRAVWTHSRAEGVVIAATFLATVLFGVRWGLVAGALSGLAVFLWISSQPRVTRIGRADGADNYRSTDRDRVELDTLPVLPVRIDRSLYFGNVGHVEARLGEIIAAHPQARCLLLDMRGVNAIDASALRMFDRLRATLADEDLLIAFAALHMPVHDALKAAAPTDDIPCFLTVEDGVQEMTTRCAAPRDDG